MIQNQFQTKTGLIQVQILDGGAVTDMEVSSLGKLKYEFDLTPSSVTIDAFQVLYQKVDIEILQFTKTGIDLYDRLRTELLSQGALAIHLIADGDTFRFLIHLDDIKVSETDRIVTLRCRPLVDRSVSALSVFDAIDDNEPILLSILQPDANVDDGVQCAGVKDWIEYALGKIFVNTDENVVYSSPSNLSEEYQQENYISFRGGVPDKIALIMARMPASKFQGLEEVPVDEKFSRGQVVSDGTGLLTGGDLEGLTVGDSIRLINTIGQSIFFTIDTILSDTQMEVSSPSAPIVPVTGIYQMNLHARLYATDAISALATVQGLAGIEGSIFGTGFGKNFFINRIQTQDIVEVDWEEVVEMEGQINYNPIGGGFVEQVAKTIKDLSTGEVNVGTEDFGVWPTDSDLTLPVITNGRADAVEEQGNDSRINLRLAPAYPFLSKGRYFPNQGRFFGKYTAPVKWDFDFSPVVALCRTGLTSIQRALSSDGTTDRIEGMIFGAKRIKPWNLVRFINAPERFNLKLFRPTSLEYDFVNDTVTINDYELGGDVPDPKKYINVAGESRSEGYTLGGRKYLMQVVGESESKGTVSIKADNFYVQLVGRSESSGEVVRGIIYTEELVGETTSEGVIEFTVIRLVEVVGESRSEGTIVRASTVNVVGESRSEGFATTTAELSQYLTTDLGISLLTDDGLYLTTGEGTDYEATVVGSSTSEGAVETLVVSGVEVFVEVAGDSRSEGFASTDSTFALYLTTDLGINLITPEGVYLATDRKGEEIEVSASGESRSSGVIVVTRIRLVEVVGEAVSSGETVPSKTELVEAIGESRSDGSVRRTPAGKLYLTTDLDIQLTTPEGLLLTTLDDFPKVAEAIGEVNSSGVTQQTRVVFRQAVGESRSQGEAVRAPFTRHVSASGEGSSAGYVEYVKEGEVFIGVSGNSSSGGVATGAREPVTRFATASGQSRSQGVVIRRVLKNIEVSVEGNAEASNGQVTTTKVNPLPPIPTGLRACDEVGFVARIEWNASANATSYTLQRRLSGGAHQVVYNGSDTQYFDTTPASNPSTQYFYRVRANNAQGSSSYSAEISVIFNQLNPCQS